MFSTTRMTLSIFVFYSFKTHSDQNMLIGPTPIYIIVVQIIFGILAIATQYTALSSKNNYSLLIHGTRTQIGLQLKIVNFEGVKGKKNPHSNRVAAAKRGERRLRFN